MQGLLELLIATAVLVWVIGPLARWQYEGEQKKQQKDRAVGNDSASSFDPQYDPLASHPFYRPNKGGRHGIM